MSNFGDEVADLIRQFRAHNAEKRSEEDREATRVKEFLADFEKRVNETIGRVVADILAGIGQDQPDITVTPTGDKEKTWYEVTFTARPEGQEERKRTIRFAAIPHSRTVVLQVPGPDGRYASINGEVPIDLVTPEKVENQILDTFKQVLGLR